MLTLLLLSSFILGTFAADCTSGTCEQTFLSGAGAAAPSAMMKQWGFSYSLLKPDVKINFAPTTGRLAFDSLASPCRRNYQVDFVASDLNMINVHKLAGVTLQNSQDIRVVPFFASAVGLVYNLAEYNSADAQLFLSRDVLLRIYTLNITHWDDPAIVSINTGLASQLKHEKIILVLQSEESGATAALNQYLRSIDTEKNGVPKHGFTFSRLWNMTLFKPAQQEDRVIDQPNSFAMVSAVLTTRYSLGYAPLAYVDQAGLPYAKIRNKWGEDIAPVPTALAAALAVANSKIEFLNISNEHVVDAYGKGVYPLTHLMYLGVHTDINTECALRRELWKFFNWVLTSDAAQAQILGSAGYGPFAAPERQKILRYLQANCSGTDLFEFELVESGSSFVRQAAISISAILLTIVALILFTLGWKRNNAITRAAGLAFATCYLLGCALNYISVFVWALIPTTQVICSARYILTALGYTLVLGAMFAKCWEIQKIFERAKSGDISPIQEVPWWKFCRVFFSVVGVNALLLLILGAIDPPKSVRIVSDPLELKAYHICYVYKTTEWAAIEFTYFALLVSWGGYLAWKTRDIWEKYNYPNESRSILLSIYNIIFCLTVLIPLTTLLYENIEVQFFLTAVAIIFPTSFALFTVYGPKVLKFLGSSFGKHSKGSAGAALSAGGKPSKQTTFTAGSKGVGDKHEEPRKRRDTNKDGLIFIEEDPKEPSTEGHQFVQGSPSPPQSPIASPVPAVAPLDSVQE